MLSVLRLGPELNTGLPSNGKLRYILPQIPFYTLMQGNFGWTYSLFLSAS